MSHLLHEYIARQVASRLRDRRVVVWYDPHARFGAFLRELTAKPEMPIQRVTVDGVEASLAEYTGSIYELRARLEPLVSIDEPDPLIIFVSGLEPSDGSPLKELEIGGTAWTPQLRQVARHALRARFTDGVIDDLLRPEAVSYEDIAAASSGRSDEQPSMLKTILGGSTSEVQLATWLANPNLDGIIEEKEAKVELQKLVSSRLALELPGGELTKWRAISARFVLAVEFRSDLGGDPPPELDPIPDSTNEVVHRARTIADHLRTTHGERYAEIADQAESELGLATAAIDPLQLGTIDTFRFEEAALLARCAELVREGNYVAVAELADRRRDSFWLAEDVDRQAQWEAIRLAARLGSRADDVKADLESPPADVAGWVTRYVENWQHLDRAQRKLEAWIPKLDDDPDERVVAAVRSRYDEVVNELARRFCLALESSGWDVPGVRHQTSIFDDLVRPVSGQVAFLMVDAMRFEMGAELADRLTPHGEVTLEPALSVLPSITVTGMAAMMPGASSSFSVADLGTKLAAEVDGVLLRDLSARKKHLAARSPSSVDLELGKVMQTSRSRLQSRIRDKDLVVVRSQEIDFYGEGGFGYQARTVMDTVVDNLARAIRKLATAGVTRFVIAADHGHLFSAENRDESMRIEAPGGDTIELHRRCWAGRGGSTPPACVRVAARRLGNDADFDLVFPAGAGVFRAGGDLAFHHGGPTLQEMVIPVITFRPDSAPAAPTEPPTMAVGEVPAAITNRMFTVQLTNASLLGSGRPVRPVLVSEGRQVGAVGMALGATEQADGSVVLDQGREASIGFMLDDDTVESLRIVVLDPATDAELYRSPADIPVALGVG